MNMSSPAPAELAYRDDGDKLVASLQASLLTVYSSKQPSDIDGLVVIQEACELATSAHAGQFRRSGEPYVCHPLTAATIVASYGFDRSSVLAAVLHDVVEDTDVTLEDIEARFGKDVSHLVDGCTKLSGLKFHSAEAAQAAEWRRMLVALANDLRVIVVKLADRLHNMRTIKALPPEKSGRIARETLEIYSPLAARLGLAEVKGELEDLSFEALYPELYQEVDLRLAAHAPERERWLAESAAAVSGALTAAGIEAEISGRTKRHWSVYCKMVATGNQLEELWDLVALRVIVDEPPTCYAVLGALHGLFEPVEGRFKDYIARPKFNLYQSLHVTLIGLGGHPLEVQVRTREMHNQAERGAAAHWSYKDGHERSPKDAARELDWVNRLLDQIETAEDAGEFLDEVRTDLAARELHVFTPQGDVIALAAGATVIDFAYAVHTEVGHRTMGGKVNDRIVPLATELVSGDRVEILTRRDPAPNPDWLSFATTARARSRIRQWFNRARRDVTRQVGADTLARALRDAAVAKADSPALLEQVAKDLGLGDVEALDVAVGEGRVATGAVLARIRGATPDRVAPRRRRKLTPTSGAVPRVQVGGHFDLPVRFASCCTPGPADSVFGFVGKSGQVSVHTTSCTNAPELHARAERGEGTEVSVSFLPGSSYALASVEVEALDRPRLLADVSSALADLGINIVASRTLAGDDMVSRQQFDLAVSGTSHLETAIAAIEGVDSVYQVRQIPAEGR
jgi:GTP pyrophosphokinase